MGYAPFPMTILSGIVSRTAVWYSVSPAFHAASNAAYRAEVGTVLERSGSMLRACGCPTRRDLSPSLTSTYSPSHAAVVMSWPAMRALYCAHVSGPFPTSAVGHCDVRSSRTQSLRDDTAAATRAPAGCAVGVLSQSRVTVSESVPTDRTYMSSSPTTRTSPGTNSAKEPFVVWATRTVVPEASSGAERVEPTCVSTHRGDAAASSAFIGSAGPASGSYRSSQALLDESTMRFGFALLRVPTERANHGSRHTQSCFAISAVGTKSQSGHHRPSLGNGVWSGTPGVNVAVPVVDVAASARREPVAANAPAARMRATSAIRSERPLRRPAGRLR